MAEDTPQLAADLLQPVDDSLQLAAKLLLPVDSPPQFAAGLLLQEDGFTQHGNRCWSANEGDPR
ncbi:MAG: hypothetical protein QM786_01250 [Breznakibacter sp.]